jgi:TPR repeat protein
MAIERAPENIRFRFEYARALAQNPSPQASEIEIVRGILEELDRINYVAGTVALGYQYSFGFFDRDLAKAEQYNEKARKMGSLEAIGNLAAIYDLSGQEKESTELWEEYVRRGGADFSGYWVSLRDGSKGRKQNFQKYFELVKLGVERGDADANSELGYLYQDRNICTCSDNVEQANRYYLNSILIRGNNYGAYRLAKNYYHGVGIREDVQEAIHWTIFAIRSGEERGYDLIYDIVSETAPSELAEAGLDADMVMHEVQSSADGGNKYSQFYLGRILEDQKRNDEALVWYRKASAQGLQPATDAVKRLSKSSDAK